VPAVGDREPPRLLGEQLAERRRRGHAWDDLAFSSTVNGVIRDLPHTQRAEWREVFNEQREKVWKAAYTRTLTVRRALDDG
jgi:hypothetical protein